MGKKYIILALMLLIFVLAQGQQVESKNFKTCGKPLKECKYRGKHPTSTPKPKQEETKTESREETKIESKYVRMDGDDIVFDLNGKEYHYKMVYVSGGTYTMGCTTEQGSDCYINEVPAHSVTVNGFYMGQTEVSQALWKAVMGSNPSFAKGNTLPVEMVSYNDCIDFISKLNSLTGKTFRLPSEAEWGYAARGGNSSRGYKYSGSDNIGSVAWYDGNSGSKTHPVAQKQANELGLYDMSGNVWEWCNDWDGRYGDNLQSHPRSPSSDSYLAFRGGSWLDETGYCRVSSRTGSTPSRLTSALGFQLAR